MTSETHNSREKSVRPKRIMHVCLASSYIDNFSYQENLLPKYHLRQGHDVSILASLVTFDSDGSLTLGRMRPPYSNEDGIPVERLEYASLGRLGRRLRIYRGVLRSLRAFSPDIVFVHGPQFFDAFKVALYVAIHPGTHLIVDNHADYINSARNIASRYVLHGIVWRTCAWALAISRAKFFGVLPARVKFLHEVYGIPKDSIDFLPIGADDDLVRSSVSKAAVTRSRLDVKPSDFLVVTGGKIDSFKTETLSLMEAIHSLDGVKLLVYGSVAPELKERFFSLVDGTRVEHVGWLSTEESSDLLAAADLVVFPGGHSVYWEQVVALGVPIVVRRWPGAQHVDHSGNCVFLDEASKEEIVEALKKLLGSPQTYRRLLAAAQSDERKRFLYSKVATQSLGQYS